MDEEIPICPSCDSSAHVILVNTFKKRGTAVSGVAEELLDMREHRAAQQSELPSVPSSL